MEEQQKPTSKITLHYGVILGVVSILISVIIYAMGMQYDEDWKSWIGIIAMAAIVFLGIKKFKEFNGGYLTIGQALKTGVGIALIGSIISLLYFFIFVSFIEPDFLANKMALGETKMLEMYPNLTDEQIEQQLEMQKKFATPAIMSAFALVFSLFFGFVFSLISGFIQKNEPNK